MAYDEVCRSIIFWYKYGIGRLLGCRSDHRQREVVPAKLNDAAGWSVNTGASQWAKTELHGIGR